ncbi:MAG: hypothetical protein ABW189_09115 [Rickettsiales bacterium]
MPANVGTAAELLTLVRTEYRNLPLRELLNKSPHVLLGVSPKAAEALELLEIDTVFDFGTSAAFDAATKLLRAGTEVGDALRQHGAATADLVRESVTAGVKVDELQYLGINALQSVPEEHADAVKDALDVQTVRDMALYPPYRAAAKILEALFFPENVEGFDPERPADLIPKTGEYPTERVQYTTLLMDEIKLGRGDTIVDVASPNFKPLDVTKLALGDAGFKKIAYGALLTLNQSWYAQGVTLGQLLHSTSLAPGESTRVAVIDWSRKSRAGETEVISETDDLTNDASHNRSINEVTQAVANESQSGFSQSNSNSHSSQSGTSSAAEMSAPLGGLFGGPSGSIGHTSSEADTSSHADSYSTSFGHRDIGSTMMQNVNDRTHQHAHSSRNRRASVVKEVAQSEHEGVSTRVLANYNHMHALTIQYYEVVQIYRIETAIVKADKVVFIPVQLIDFNNDTLIRRFQNILARKALTYAIREALQNLDVLEISPDKDAHFTVLGSPLSIFLQNAFVMKPEVMNAAGLQSAVGAKASDAAKDKEDKPASTAPNAEKPMLMTAAMMASPVQLSSAMPVFQQINDYLWTSDQTARISGLLNRGILRKNSNAIYLPTDVSIEGSVIAGAGNTALSVVYHKQSGSATTVASSDNPVHMSDLTRIGIKGHNPERNLTVAVTLTLNRNGVRFPLELPTVTVHGGISTEETKLVRVKPGGVNANLKQHLNDNRMYYSQAVFRALDSTQIALLLSGYGVEIGGKLVPVAQVVEPKPIRYIGNYLAFKMNTDSSADEQWAGWLEDHGIRLGSAKEEIVPLPSGGTFAEAVLGRSNCAEKLDITRFWNWQDSPIPLQPTEIAAIQTGSRATNEDVKPGQLSNPIINITQPSSLPDPSGTAAVLAAIQNGNMFRDMSGLQATIGLAQAALQATSAGASTAGQQAGENMNNLLKANTERQRIAAEMISSLAQTAASAYTGGAAGGGKGVSGGGSHSQDGAKINYFDKAPAKTPSAPSGGDSKGGAAPVAPSGSSSGGGGGFSDSGIMTAAYNPSGYSQNPAALAATWGDAEPRSSLMRSVLDFADNGLTAEELEAAGGGGKPKNVQTKELNVAGEFEWDPSITDAEEIAELTAGRWSPSTQDFVAVPGGTVAIAPTLGHLLGAILQEADGSVSRINLFTHANKGMVAFGGHIEQRAIGRADVFLNTNGPNDSLTAMDKTGMQALNAPGVFFTAPKAIKGKTDFTVADVQKKFAEGAVFVLYACHSGQDAAFMKEIAKFFNIKVIGFKPEIGYYPPNQTTPNKFKRAGEKIGLGFGGSPVTDWRGLISDAQAIVAVP